jgi:hypothetical protein
MQLKLHDGGFKLSADDQAILYQQRAITKAINDQFIQVGAVFLKQSSKNPYDDEWFKSNHRDTNLQSWIDDPELQGRNVGFNLQFGWMDIDIDASDPAFNECVVAALKFCGIDVRFQFGRASAGVASHILVQLAEEEAANFEEHTRFEPKEFRIEGKRYHVQLRSYATNVAASNVAKNAKQTVVPGSIYTHKNDDNTPDISVWFANGSYARNVKQIAATTPRRVSYREVLRAIAFATFLYTVRDHWTEGNRQATAQKVSGWLARIVKDSRAINNHEVIAKDVYCSVDDDDIAEKLLMFVCRETGDEEGPMRVRVLRDAIDKLNRNPDAKIPGWPAMEQLLGSARVAALRTVFMPGSDVSVLTAMAERYIYDEDDDRYIDRERFLATTNFVHESAALERRHKGDVVRVGGKPKEAFRVFEASDMRKRVGKRELYPELPPGSLNIITSLGEILKDDDADDPTALVVFNTWRGWPVAPTTSFDASLMQGLVDRLDQVLRYLTQDRDDQIRWIKQWLAWTLQHPGDKQQIAWAVLGEQGIGKSWIGNIFVNALMGSLWGSASPKVMDGDFSVEPFINRMFTFIDEAKFHSDAGVEEIKKIIRSVEVPGAEKFQSARTYRLFSRIMFASNRLDLGLGKSGQLDRAFFFTRAYDREFKHCTEIQFRQWAETLKPFFTEFTALMQQRIVKEHFMKYFMEFETDKYEVESIKHSSSTDAVIVTANMTWSRRIARFIVEEGRIFEDLDITYPFTASDLNRRVSEVGTELGLRNVQAARVIGEFEQADVLEKVVVSGAKKMRFKYKLGTLSDVMSAAIGVELESHFILDKDKDFGPNDCDGSTRPPWKGNKRGVVQEAKEKF